jgi:hypothetical protein
MLESQQTFLNVRSPTTFFTKSPPPYEAKIRMSTGIGKNLVFMMLVEAAFAKYGQENFYDIVCGTQNGFEGVTLLRVSGSKNHNLENIEMTVYFASLL